MHKGSRIALKADPTWTGVATTDPSSGKVAVRGDTGWSGTLDTDALMPEPVATQDKSWPPAGMEHK